MRMGVYTMHGGKNLLVREKVLSVFTHITTVSYQQIPPGSDAMNKSWHSMYREVPKPYEGDNPKREASPKLYGKLQTSHEKAPL